MHQANPITGRRTPAAARATFAAQGWNYERLVQSSARMPKHKCYRFGDDAMQQCLKVDNEFLACEYLTLICQQSTRAIHGRTTAMLRARFGLNDVVGLNDEKSRNGQRRTGSVFGQQANSAATA